MAFPKKIFKPCYRCHKNVPPHMGRAVLVDKITYTLCVICRHLIEEADEATREEFKEEQEAVTLWTIKKDREAKKRQAKLDDERFRRLRLILSGE